MALICNSCSHENPDASLFCHGCGQPLSEGHAVGDLIGQEILGTYKLVELLGEGGMSVVYRARHVLTEQDVAIKVLPPELATQREVKARFIEEARTLAKLEHPNIVVLHNFVESNGFLYLVMQCAEGETFDTIIEREGRVEPGEAVSVAIEVLRALEYAHDQGVIHRDIKPSNIILRDDGTVKVMDFGIAKIMGSSKLTQTGQTMGTVRYMSPEQVRGKNIEHCTDIYSLGVTLYEALVGRTPFDGETHFEIMQKQLSEAPTPPGKLVALPRQLDEVVLKALAKKVDQRYQRAREFRKALEQVPLKIPKRLTASLQVQATSSASAPEPALRRPRHSSRAKRLMPLVLALLLLLLAVGLTAWALLGEGRQDTAAGDSGLSGEGQAGATPKELPWPEPHYIARQLEWRQQQRYGPPVRLRLMATKPVDFAAIKQAYVEARAAYPRFLKEEGMDLEFVVGPLNLAVVDQAMLNSKKYWPDVKPHVDYPTRYLAPSATLYVNNAAGFLKTDLPYGLALHFCARIGQLSNERCLELAEGFEVYLRHTK